MKRIGKWLVFLLLAGALCGCAKEEEQEAVPIRNYDASLHEGKEYILENDDLKFEFDPATTQFTLTQKNTGKVWYSNPPEGANDPQANASARKNLQSTLVLEYTTINAVSALLNSYEFSVANGIYEVEASEDEIRVLYTIGKVKKTFFIPMAVPESRMKEFYDKMERSQQKKLDDYYRRYDINNLLATDNKSDLLSQYPDLENERVYVLRESSSSKEFIMRQIEEMFSSVGYTEEDYYADLERYSSSSSSDKVIINLTVVYRLDGNRFIVEIPNDEIAYNEDYPLTKISLLPYFGAGGTEDEGYLLVPEGSGALIRFNNGKSEQSAYYADVYGWDYGKKRTELVDETRSAMPVYGIANGDSSFLSVMEEYGTIASIRADVSGRQNSYNYAYATYEIIHSDKMDISAKSDRTVLAFEEDVPEGKIVQSYTFFKGTDYVNMAETYRDYLQRRYPELQKVADTELPVAVEFIGAIDRVKQILGFPVKRPEVLTSFAEAQEILAEMLADGYENLSVRYSGWMNGGISHTMAKNIKLTSGMGGKKALKALMDYANTNGVDVYLSGRVETANNSNLLDGFLRSRDSAKHVSREVIEHSPFSAIWFGELAEKRMGSYYLLRPSVCLELMEGLAKEAADYKAGVGFEDIGYLLSADYNPKRLVTREQVMKLQSEALAKIHSDGTKIMVSAGNEYALPYADIVTNVDLEGKTFAILDESVPFYEIVVHGLVNYTGDAINLSGNPWTSVLKCAEMGAGLSFAFMKSDADALQNSEYMDYFGAYYDGWKDWAKEYYLRYKEEMAGLNNQYITGHSVLEPGVTTTTYENGTVVYVNYNNEDYTNGTLTVPARDYLVERRGN